jgi:hypothetical protein
MAEFERPAVKLPGKSFARRLDLAAGARGAAETLQAHDSAERG